MALVKCPDCKKEISDLAEFCIGCGRPMSSKSQQQTDIGAIFSDSPTDKIKEQSSTDQSNSSFVVFVAGFLIILALLIVSITSSHSQGSNQGVSIPSNLSKTNYSQAPDNTPGLEISKPLSVEDVALQAAIDFTKSHPNSSLNMKIIGYKYALEELDKIKKARPSYKTDIIASLSKEFASQKMSLENELKEQEAILKKEAEERRPLLEKEARESAQRLQQLEAKLKKLEKKFRKEKDEVNKTDFLTHKAFPAYSNSRSCIYPYVGKSGYARWLRIKIQYTADSWLFVEKLIFSIDDVNVVKEFGPFEWKRDHNGGSIWEWVDLSGDEEQLQLLEKIAKSKKTILRFEGRQYYKDITISSADKKAILETVEYYKAS